MERFILELFIIRETAKGVWERFKRTKSLLSVLYMFFDPNSKYKFDDGEWKKGNYYTYQRDFWGSKIKRG